MSLFGIIQTIRAKFDAPATERTPTWTNMTFGQAIEAMKDGHSMRRAGWNGRGMLVYMIPGAIARMPEDTDQLIDGVSARFFDHVAMGTITRMPNLNMRTANDATVTGWLASQTDMLAEDWEMVL